METPEHIWIVDSACKDFFGKTYKNQLSSESSIFFTYGEISALAGDFFQTPNELELKSKASRAFIDKHYRDGNCDGSLCIASEVGTFEALNLSGNYLNYALVNFDHFRTGLPSRNAISKYKHWHQIACNMGDRIAEGFALHYLVDLFASGHMRTPRGSSFNHLVKNLGYTEANAEIVSGLLSKIAHDADNMNGVQCGYQTIDEYMSLKQDFVPSGLLSATNFSLFLGDSHLVQSVEKNWNNSQIQHLKEMVCLSIADCFNFSNRASSGPLSIDVEFAPAEYLERKTKESNKYSRNSGFTNINEFLNCCLPTPILEDQNHVRGAVPRCLMYLTSSPDSEKSEVAWRLPGVYKSVPMIDVEIYTDSRKVISKVKIHIEYSSLICGTVTVATGLLTKNPISTFRAARTCSEYLDPMDGNDPKLLELFKIVKSAGTLSTKVRDFFTTEES